MIEVLTWLAVIAVIGGLGYAALLYAQGAFEAGGGGLFRKPRAEPRLFVVEQSAMDAKRRLVLIRRDDVEHLIMTGGPVDVVIETGIAAPRPEPLAPEAVSGADAGAQTSPRRFGSHLAPNLDRIASAPMFGTATVSAAADARASDQASERASHLGGEPVGPLTAERS